jgi:hypothetical protein
VADALPHSYTACITRSGHTPTNGEFYDAQDENRKQE